MRCVKMFFLKREREKRNKDRRWRKLYDGISMPVQTGSGGNLYWRGEEPKADPLPDRESDHFTEDVVDAAIDIGIGALLGGGSSDSGGSDSGSDWSGGGGESAGGGASSDW